MHPLRAAVATFFIVAAVYCLCPIATSGDSRWTIPIALNLLEHGSTSIEPYRSVALHEPSYRWELVDGRMYATYPVAVAVIAAPFIPPLKLAVRIIHPTFSSPVLRAFFSGDFVTSYGLVEMLIASMLTALAAAVQMLIALEFLPLPSAALLTFTFAFATPAWSTASRSMGNHTPALLMLMVALYLLIVARRDQRVVAYAGIPLAVAFMVRPTMAISVVILTAFVAIYYPRRLLSYLLLTAPLAALFFAYNLTVRHAWFQRYFTDPGAWPPASFAERFGLQLVSPSRGLFVFSPVLLFALAGIWIACRRRWLFPLTPFLIAIIVAQVVLVTKYYWPGYSYGPRYFTEMTPLLTLFLIPVLQRRYSKPLFFALLAFSVFVHARGATSFAAHRWNDTPRIVDLARAWDWRDPQFLRGLL